MSQWMLLQMGFNKSHYLRHDEIDGRHIGKPSLIVPSRNRFSLTRPRSASVAYVLWFEMIG